MSNRFSVPGLEVTANDEQVISNIVATSVNPIVDGLDFPIGTLALSSNGNTYYKWGAGNLNWNIHLTNINFYQFFPFGSQYQYAESLTTSITSVAFPNYSNKLTLNIPTAPIGTYRLGWSYSWNLDSSSDNFYSRIVLDGNTGNPIMLHAQEPSDSLGSGINGTDQRLKASGFINLTFSSVTTHALTLDFSAESARNPAAMWDARLEFWRIS